MLRDDKNMPISRPVPRKEPVYEKPTYERPSYERPSYERPPYDEYDCPKYDCPDYDYPDHNCPEFKYPMMPMYPNNMFPYPCPCPCPYMYPERHMYGDREISLEDMMRRNPMLRRCVMECVERYGQSNNNCNPCRPPQMPMPRRDTRRPCCGLDEYEFEEIELESHIEELEAEDMTE